MKKWVRRSRTSSSAMASDSPGDVFALRAHELQAAQGHRT
jgi:hypothetical protein